MLTDKQKNAFDIFHQKLSRQTGIDYHDIYFIRSLYIGQGYSRDEIIQVLIHSVKKRNIHIKALLKQLPLTKGIENEMIKFHLSQTQDARNSRQNLLDIVKNCSDSTWEIIVESRNKKGTE